jgi:hypothetical protein
MAASFSSSTSARRGPTGGLAVVFAVALFTYGAPARAVPITYLLQVFGGPASGTLGGVAFSNADIIVTFDGDTADVIPFSLPAIPHTVTGFEMLKGTGTISIFQSNQPALTATFLPSAGMFFSVDTTNSSVGIGSHGVLPSDPTFPGQPVYPLGDVLTTGSVATWDATTDISLAAFPLSCVNFPAQCGAPLPLATTAGDLLLDSFGALAALFRATVHSLVTFADFSASAEARGSRFELASKLTLGSASNGIDPTTEVVTLQAGALSGSLPAGSFAAHGSAFTYDGPLGGAKVHVRIAPKSIGRYAIQVEGSGVRIGSPGDTVAVTVTIGDDTGTTNSRLHRLD